MNFEGLSDKRAYLQVIGSLMLDASLIEDVDRPLCQEDFNTDRFYVIVYSSIYNLFINGCQVIDEYAVDSYLSNESFKEQYAIFKDNNGVQYLNEAKTIAEINNYDYYYHRVRKFSLLRYYEKLGLDTRFIYDDTATDPRIAVFQHRTFDELSENEIVEVIESKFVIDPSIKFCSNNQTTEIQAAKGGKELIQELMKVPDFGISLNNEALNTIARGARLGCLYMDSFPSGEGKSRTAIGHAMRMAVPCRWNNETQNFIDTVISEPTLYISTEMGVSEIQTMMYATISGVNEEKILYGMYEDGELERVNQAIDFIENSPLYIVHLPEFDIQDVLNIIKKYHREYNVNYFFFDYLQSTVKLMTELTSKSKISGLKEHQMLLLFITKLKAIAEELHIFIWTSSQLSDEVNNVTKYDQHLLSGSKALVNKLDVGIISKRVEPIHLKKIEPILHKMMNIPEPNYFHSVYKLRRGKLTKLMVWCYIDLGIMTERPLFVTDFNYELKDIDFTKIKITKRNEKKIEEFINENSTLESMERYDEVVENEDISEEKIVNNNISFDW